MATLLEKDTPVIRYRVVSPLAILPDETDGQRYVYFDQLLPAHTDPAIVAHLLAVGCVRQA